MIYLYFQGPLSTSIPQGDTTRERNDEAMPIGDENAGCGRVMLCVYVKDLINYTSLVDSLVRV